MTFYSVVRRHVKLTKAEAERRHAKRRARIRFDIPLNRELRIQIISFIQRGKTIVVEERSLRTPTHLLKIDGRLVAVVYDKDRHEIVTVLIPTPEHLERARRKIKLKPK